MTGAFRRSVTGSARPDPGTTRGQLVGVLLASVKSGVAGKTSSVDTDDALIERALAVRDRAYVPYSGFAMGAAVETDDGTVVGGAVVENISLGLAMCAERVALFATVASGNGAPRRLALASPRTDGQLTTPCGACLQVALELGGSAMEVVVVDPDGAMDRTTVGALLPRGPRKRD